MDHGQEKLKYQSWRAWKETLDEALSKLALGDIKGATNILEGAKNTIDNALVRENVQ